VRHFRDSDAAPDLKVPHIGWNGLKFSGEHASCVLETLRAEDKVYFVHSFRVVPEPAMAAWTLTTTTYGGRDFVSAVQKGNVVATQFHPEKSGVVGLQLLGRFLSQHAQVARAAALKVCSRPLPADLIFTWWSLALLATGHDASASYLRRVRRPDDTGEARAGVLGRAVQRQRRLGRHQGRPGPL
jgi:hypothetical protein